MNTAVTLHFTDPSELANVDRASIRSLAGRCMDVEPAWLDASLGGCDRLILYRDGASGAIVGTTALKVIDREYAGQKVRLLYTGAVMIDEAWRLRNLIHKAGLASVLRYGLLTTRRVYWLSECDSFRAYLLAVRNLPEVWPRCDEEVPEFEAGLMAMVCRELFGEDWDAVSGTCAAIPGRRLHAAVSEVPDAMIAKDRDTAYYVARNPAYRDGAALPVLARISVPAMLYLLRRLLLRQGRRRSLRPGDAAISGWVAGASG